MFNTNTTFMKRTIKASATALMLFFGMSLFAQNIAGTVSSSGSGDPIPSAAVKEKGSNNAAVTNFDGKYVIKARQGATLVVSALGFATKEVVASGDVVNISLSESVNKLDEVVVTALGITRDKKSLGYSVQEVKGAEVSKVKDANFMASLSGKVAGVSIRQSGTMGGSSSVVVRGFKSLTGSNQALFVVDGIPISNEINNTSNQQTGRGGYDYGNAAMDINSDDVESVSILKGAAATALYGSRAANGVIMITTKKGAKRNGLGVTVSSGLTVGQINLNTYTKYQKEYGQGYGKYYGPDTIAGYYTQGYMVEYDANGDGIMDICTPTTEDASFGLKFDPNLMVYTWESVFGDLGNGGVASPHVAGANDPTSFFQRSLTKNNSIAIDGGSDNSTFRFSATQFDMGGILPNSRLVRNNMSINGSIKASDKLTVTAIANYINQSGTGRYGTGYSGLNPNQQFRQWWDVGVDVAKLKEYYDKTGKNITWNPYGYGYGSDMLRPIYSDNAYFTAYQNYNQDSRNRIIGNVAGEYKINSWLSLFGRASVDTYTDLQEERIAVGSADLSSYTRRNRSFTERNFDLFFNVNKDLSDDLNFNGSFGTNSRRTYQSFIGATTNGGLVVPGVYALNNSVSTPNAPTEAQSTIGVDGYFGRGSFGYKNFLFADLTGRYDISSTLPADKNGYFYPSASLSIVFSELVSSDALSFGKLRLNYAEVGASAPAQALYNAYVMGTAWGSVSTASAPSTSNNSNLVPEQTRSLEAGLEMMFFQNKVGFDASVYDATSYNQIMPARVSSATGSIYQYVNAGTIQNRGIELSVNATPVSNDDFEWKTTLNWTRNRNKVVSLFEGAESLQLASVQGGIAIEARVGEAYGNIYGTTHERDSATGLPIVYDMPSTTGGGVRYVKGDKDVIGNINPDWIGGWNNSFRYKNVNFSFLIDFQKGGSVFSLDTWYGYATGLYDWSAGLNDKGGEVRGNPGAVTETGMDGTGGYAMGRVMYRSVDANGDYTYTERDDLYGNVTYYGNTFGYARSVGEAHVYDASFVKLREMALTYSVPAEKLSSTSLKGLDFSLVGRNLAILYKNVPYADPEAGLSAGNVQGYQSGAYPSVREMGLNVKLKF